MQGALAGPNGSSSAAAILSTTDVMSATSVTLHRSADKIFESTA